MTTNKEKYVENIPHSLIKNNKTSPLKQTNFIIYTSTTKQVIPYILSNITVIIMKVSMQTIVSLLAVAVVVPFGGNSVQAGYPGPGCPDADEAAIEEKTFCNSFSVSATGQPRVCPGPTPGFGYTCDRSNGDNSGGTWYVERLPQSHTIIFFFYRKQ